MNTGAAAIAGPFALRTSGTRPVHRIAGGAVWRNTDLFQFLARRLARLLRRALLHELEELSRVDVATLVDARGRRLSGIGGGDARPRPAVQSVLKVGN